jgi:hypothetical protein
LYSDSPSRAPDIQNSFVTSVLPLAKSLLSFAGLNVLIAGDWTVGDINDEEKLGPFFRAVTLAPVRSSSLTDCFGASIKKPEGTLPDGQYLNSCGGSSTFTGPVKGTRDGSEGKGTNCASFNKAEAVFGNPERTRCSCINCNSSLRKR